MSNQYATRDGDSVDYICWKHYGQQSGAVEAVYSANPGLADLGALLPAGIIIVLPELAKPAETVRVIRLWD